MLTSAMYFAVTDQQSARIWCMDVVLTSVLRMAGGRMVLTVYTVQHCSAPQSVAGCLPAMWHTAPPLHHNQGHV